MLTVVAGQTTSAAGSNLATSSAGSTTPDDTSGGGATCEVDPDVTITIVNAGGEESDAIQRGYGDPFTEATGVEVAFDPPNDFGRLQAMAEAGDPGSTADIFNVDGLSLETAVAEGLALPLDLDVVDPDPALEGAITDYAVGFQYYSTLMAWSPDAVSDDGPQTWQDFFDTEKYPGRRALADYVTFTLPIAALGSGVAPEDLYPLDVDRAFEFLEEHKDDVAVWWTAGAQPVDLLKAGEVDFAMGWNGRLFSGAQDGGLEYTFNQGLLDLAYMVIPVDAPHPCEAMHFLHQVTIAENQAAAAEVLPYGGTAEGIDEYLPQEIVDEFPTSEANYSMQVIQDNEWWAENYADVQARWEEFKLGL
jgi:putative spermidine/putrescine transport system substrate-binding protein